MNFEQIKEVSPEIFDFETEICDLNANLGVTFL